MDFLKKAVDSGTLDKAVDSAVQNKDKVAAAVGDAATKAGVDGTKTQQQISDAIGDGTQLKAQLNKMTGGSAPAPAPAPAPAAPQ